MIMSRAFMLASFLFVLFYILVGVDASLAVLEQQEAEQVALERRTERTGRSAASSREFPMTAEDAHSSTDELWRPQQLVSPFSVEALQPPSRAIRPSAISAVHTSPSLLRSHEPPPMTLEEFVEGQERERAARRAARRQAELRDISRGKPYNIEPTNPQVQVRPTNLSISFDSLPSNVAYVY